ncbi:MAG: acetamidase/formamidase family protein [Clostridiales bacterium]|nr:acetamidase/formamidase family protein [Clostridiales bacterium]
MLGPVKDGGFIVANTAPGCWGPMITPALRGGHEVTTPVYVEGAEVGDAIAIRIKSVEVTSQVTSSGVEFTHDDRYNGDPFVAGRCSACGTEWPESALEGTGPDAVRCKVCGAPVSAFGFASGYTIAFDDGRRLGVTLDQAAADRVAARARDYMSVPDASIQNPVVALAPAHLPGLAARMRPFLGQLGTTPSVTFPDSHNAGDFGMFLVGAPHPYALTEAQLAHRTDGHMDINRVRPGAILICPVKVPGGGVYMGDAHALQGNGEIAGHTCDVSATVTLQVSVLKGLGNAGPILLPLPEDLPCLAVPLSAAERAVAQRQAAQWGVAQVEEALPLSFIGSGANLNAAIDNALERAAALLDMGLPEVKNRATINGSIDVGRAPGVVTATFLVPKARLEALGLLALAEEQYGHLTL